MNGTLRFEDRSIGDAVFRNCAMPRSRFDDVDLSDARYDNVALQRASFRNVNMAGVSIDDAKGLTVFGYDVRALISWARGGAGAMTAEPQLFVTDIDAACRFYVERLGFTIAFSHGEPAFYAQIARNGARLNLRRVSGAVFDGSFRQREADALSATITVDDAGAIFREFEEAGITFHQPLRTEPWGARTFIVRDPDGNLIAFAGRPG